MRNCITCNCYYIMDHKMSMVLQTAVASQKQENSPSPQAERTVEYYFGRERGIFGQPDKRVLGG